MPKNKPLEDGDGGVVTETRAEKKLKRPPLYKVLFHNDDYTTREFVVFVLQTVFHHDEASATRIMWHVHTTGVGVAGVYTFEVAETKARKVEALAQENEFPLRVSVEPED
jgi:ATP-dependent Clp protease adaptor protein ClpS